MNCYLHGRTDLSCKISMDSYYLYPDKTFVFIRIKDEILSRSRKFIHLFACPVQTKVTLSKQLEKKL